MGAREIIEGQGAGAASTAYVPPFQLTEGQPPPIAHNGGISYMALDKDGDAGTAAATEVALARRRPCGRRASHFQGKPRLGESRVSCPSEQATSPANGRGW